VRITLSKARNVAARHRQGKRDVRRENLKRQAEGSRGTATGTILDKIDSDGPTPAEAVLLNEALECRFKLLSDPVLRQIAQWKLEGYTNAEIAAQLHCTQRTVERKLERIRIYWQNVKDER
jgi:DNA-directed RNA polymerase specialized sigma24 family protein